MNFIVSFLKNKKAGFYVGLVAAVLCLVSGIVYAATFARSENPYIVFHTDICVMLILAFVLFVGLSVLKITSPYAAVGMFVLQFVAFFQFVSKSYMYLSEVFFGVSDVGGAMSALFTMHFGYLFTVLSFIVVAILSIVAIFKKQNKEEPKMEAATNEK